VGCCKFGENWDQSPSDMIVDAAYEAYADAGIEDPQRQIDAVYTGSVYTQRGPHECSDALKLWKPVSMVTNYCATGTDAFRCGVMSIAAGVYDTVLVVGYDKPKDRGVSGPSVMMNQVRDLPQTPAGWFSLCAATYFEKYGASRADLARIRPGVDVWEALLNLPLIPGGVIFCIQSRSTAHTGHNHPVVVSRWPNPPKAAACAIDRNLSCGLVAPDSIPDLPAKTG